jgi:hypothetical protein
VNPTYVASLVFAVGSEGIDMPIPNPANNDKIQKGRDRENILKLNVQNMKYQNGGNMIFIIFQKKQQQLIIYFFQWLMQ